MAFLVYDGSAMDVRVVPQKHVIGENGKPIKRRIAVPAKTELAPIPVRHLWGVDFPEGVPVEVLDEKLIAKALAVGGFSLADNRGAVIEGAPEETTGDEPAPQPKRRGRPRKAQSLAGE